MKKNNQRQLICRAAYYEEERHSFWIVTAYSSFLLRIDLQKGKVCEAYRIPFEQISDYMIISMARWKDYLVFAPYNCSQFFLFSLTQNRFSELPIQLSDEERLVTGKFSNVVIEDNKAFFLGCFLHCLISYNFETGDVKRTDFDFEKGRLCFDDFFFDNGAFIIPRYQIHQMIHFDTTTDVTTHFPVSLDSDAGGITAAVYQHDKNILITENGTVAICNKAYDVIRCLDISSIFDFEGDFIYKIFSLGEKMIFFPLKSLHLFGFEPGEYSFYPLPDFTYEDVDCIGENYSKYEMIYDCDHSIFFQTRSNGNVYEIKEDGTVHAVPIEVPLNLAREMSKTIISKSKNAICENYTIDLQDLLLQLSCS